MRLRPHPSLWLWALPSLACTGHRPLLHATDAGAPIPGGKPVAQTSVTVLFPTQRPIDLLFVIDNSASMAAKQGLLLQSLATMMLGLEKLEGGLPDVRIGVVSTDLGAGQGAAGGDCGECIAAPLIDRDPDTPDVQPDCQVSISVLGDDSGKCGGRPAQDELVPECLDPASGLPVNPDNPRPQLDAIPDARRPCWYFMHDRNPDIGCLYAFDNQKVALLFKPGQLPPQGGMWTATCQTEPLP
jgi:hypothetical protein